MLFVHAWPPALTLSYNCTSASQITPAVGLSVWEGEHGTWGLTACTRAQVHALSLTLTRPQPHTHYTRSTPLHTNVPSAKPGLLDYPRPTRECFRSETHNLPPHSPPTPHHPPPHYNPNTTTPPHNHTTHVPRLWLVAHTDPQHSPFSHRQPPCSWSLSAVVRVA